MMSMKKLLISSVAVALLAGPVINTGDAYAHNNAAVTQKVKNIKLSTKKAEELAAKLAKIKSYVQMGGTYKEGEYKTFTYKGKTYRYLAKDIDTKKELLNYMKGTLTQDAALQLIDDLGIFKYRGKMAQLEADGGSLLQWNKAKAEYV